jgi:hypothetical protein
VNKNVVGQRKRKPEKKHKGENRYRRATGGIITGVKLRIKEKRYEKREEEACMERKVHIGNKWWKTRTIYSKQMKTTRKRIEDAMNENIFLGGDFNGKIGERGARNWEEEREDGKRKSKDKIENAEGKRLMEWIEENGWGVLNGNKQGNEEGEWTYTYR